MGILITRDASVFRKICASCGLFILLVAYVCIASVVFLKVEPEITIGGQEVNNTFGDSLYFTVVTLTTVGYGDISADTNGGKGYVICLIAFTVIFVALGSEYTHFIWSLDHDKKNVAERCMSKFFSPAKTVFYFYTVVLGTAGWFGAWYYYSAESLSEAEDGQGWLTAFYFSVVTLTTVGYGDYSANSQNTRDPDSWPFNTVGFTTIWILVGWYAFVAWIGSLVSLILESREKELLEQRAESVALGGLLHANEDQLSLSQLQDVVRESDFVFRKLVSDDIVSADQLKSLRSAFKLEGDIDIPQESV